jgi:hypothetical protein
MFTIGITASGSRVATLAYSVEVLADSPLGYWKLDDTVAALTVCIDSSGNGYQGTFTANLNREQPPLINTGTSIEWTNEAAGGVNINGAIAALQLTGDMSAEAWVNLNAFDASNAYIVVCSSIISRPEQASDNFLWSLSVNSAGFVNMFWEYAGGTNQSVTSTHAITTSTVHHLAVVRDTSALTVTFYDNGVEYDTVGYANNPAGGTDSIVQIGKRFGGGEVDGFIDQVAVYNTKLSAARILAHYNAGV